MKANEAPEKLYLLPNGLISYCRNTDEDVEYTRTDAFIEKACDWLKNNLPSAMVRSDFYMFNGEFIKDFEEYLKK